jgi:hypothetical protein
MSKTRRMQKNAQFEESNGGCGEYSLLHGLGLIKKPKKTKQSPQNLIVMLEIAQIGRVSHES